VPRIPPTPITPPSSTNPFPANPPPAVLQPGVTYPIVGPRLSAYGVVQPLSRQLGQTMLGTLHERVGNSLTQPDAALRGASGLALGNTPVASDTAPRIGGGTGGWAPAAWGRVIGVQIADHLQAYADPRANGRIVGFEAGLDLWRGSVLGDGHRDVAGVYVGYLNAAADVTGLVTNDDATAYTQQRTGSVALNGYSFGAYWTHYAPSGWYVDGVLQGTVYAGTTAATFQSVGVSTAMSTHGTGFVASLESGYPLRPALGLDFVIEPQAQLVYQYVGFHATNDGLTTVDLGTTSGGAGRLGLLGQWTITDGSGQVWQPYLRGSLWQSWGGDAETLFSHVAVPVPLVEQATSLEFAAGLTIQHDAMLSLYIQAGYQFTVAPSSIQQRGITGNVGLRYAW
jgi:outer membrane autotransporter protein